MDMLLKPFGVDFDLVHGIMKDPQVHTVRLASSMRGHYKDAKALEALVAQGDPVHYEVFEMKIPEEAGQLQFCLSKTYPGTVGGECFMTKGHYHAAPGTAEIYLCLRGEGYMLMKLASGESAYERFLPGAHVLCPAVLGTSHGEHRGRAADLLLRLSRGSRSQLRGHREGRLPRARVQARRAKSRSSLRKGREPWRRSSSRRAP